MLAIRLEAYNQWEWAAGASRPCGANRCNLDVGGACHGARVCWCIAHSEAIELIVDR